MQETQQLKDLAKAVRKHAGDLALDMTHAQALEIIGRTGGYSTWASARACMNRPEAATNGSPGKVSVTLNEFDDEGDMCDSHSMDLSLEQISDIVDHAAQFILLRRSAGAEEIEACADELEEALTASGVLSDLGDTVVLNDGTPSAIVKALHAVREAFPDVDRVRFDRDLRWRFMSKDGSAPDFMGKIDVGLLEDAADAVGDMGVDLPLTFQMPLASPSAQDKLTWTNDDAREADAEGWNIFSVERGEGHDFDLERWDEAEIFAGDDQAWSFVFEKHSALHVRAMRFLEARSPVEHANICKYVSTRQRSLEELYALWGELGDVPTTQDGVSRLDAPWLHFARLTPVEDVWHWFERQNPSFIVGEVMQGIRRKARSLAS